MPSKHVTCNEGDFWPDQAQQPVPCSTVWFLASPRIARLWRWLSMVVQEKPFLTLPLIWLVKGTEHLTSVCHNISCWLLSNLILLGLSFLQGRFIGKTKADKRSFKATHNQPPFHEAKMKHVPRRASQGNVTVPHLLSCPVAFFSPFTLFC